MSVFRVCAWNRHQSLQIAIKGVTYLHLPLAFLLHTFRNTLSLCVLMCGNVRCELWSISFFCCAIYLMSLLSGHFSNWFGAWNSRRQTDYIQLCALPIQNILLRLYLIASQNGKSSKQHCVLHICKRQQFNDSQQLAVVSENFDGVHCRPTCKL